MFRAPSFAIFTDLLTGWVLAPGRRAITAMIAVADPAGRRAHDAYHRFLRDGAWQMSGLWRLLATHAVSTFAATGVVSLDCDDTLFHKSGRKVAGAGTFRDAVRSTGGRVVYALGLNLVVVTLRVTPPWGSMPIAVPVNARLHSKNDPISTVEYAAQMMRELASWLPDRQLQLAVAHEPVRYRQLVADSKPKRVRPRPPDRRGHPPSLDRPLADRPWRAFPSTTVQSDE